tara:strand:+ start:16272 stop:17069 length:798 start_codon:yes stop_codon:yes gene_type:complete
MHAYIKTDQLLHRLSQLIAKMNRQFVAKKEDDSHTNFYFDPLQGAIISHWLDTNMGPIIFRLNLLDWSFDFVDGNFNLLDRVDLQTTKLSELEQHIVYGMEKLALNSKGFTDKMHFKIPDYELADDCLKTMHPFNLEEWMVYRSLANHACYEVLGSLQRTGEVRIWPHHFDTGIYFKLKNNVHLSFGLAMQDDHCPDPYFYASAFNNVGASIKVNPPQSSILTGKWISSSDFNSAIFSLKELKKSHEDLLKSYIRSFLKIYLSLL